MKNLYTYLLSATMILSAVTLTSCVQKDVAEAPEYSKKKIALEGVILVNNDIFVPLADQTWSAPGTAIEIVFEVENSSLSDIGESVTTVKTKCNPKTGEFKVSLPAGAYNSTGNVTIKSFKSTITREDPDMAGEEEIVEVMWYETGGSFSLITGDVYYETWVFDANDALSYKVIEGSIAPGDSVN